MVKIKDVALRAGVSNATVSLALNGSPLVNSQTRERIRGIAREMGYRPNPYAQKLVSRKSGTVGLIIPDIKNIYFAELVDCVNKFVQERGYGLLTAMSDNSPEQEKKAVEYMKGNRTEGLLVAPVTVENRALSYLGGTGAPLVFTTAAYDDCDYPRVMSDLESGMYEMTKYAVGKGKKKLAYLTGPERVMALDLRQSGFIRAAAGVKHTIIRVSEVSYEAACEAAERIARSAEGFDAVICVNDMMAVGVVNTLLSRGISVPGEIAVCGFDDTVFARISPVPVTTVRQRIDEIARKSVEVLFALINGAQVPERITVANELIIRKSL